MLPIGSALNAKRRRMSGKRPPPAWHAALMLKGFTEVDLAMPGQDARRFHVHHTRVRTHDRKHVQTHLSCLHNTQLSSTPLHSTPHYTAPHDAPPHHSHTTTRTTHHTHTLHPHRTMAGGYCCRNKLGNTWASCPPTPPIPHFFNVVRNGQISITRRLLLSCQINIEVHGWRGLPVFLNIFRQPTERMDSSST